ncbi:MAG TPA: redoxin family protein [Blastocatellia bacterium]|nr:redoxin family protein [Blastocatellia bacterium]
MKLTLFFTAIILSFALASPASAQEESPSPRPKLKTPAEKQKEEAPKETQKSPPAPQDSDTDLRRAIQEARGSEQQFVENIEGYLKKYPNSQHRVELERELYKLGVQLRDRNRAITYGIRLVEANLNDFDTLMSLISLLRERRAEGDLPKALTYSNQLVEAFENLFARDKPARVSAAQWEDRKSRGLASVYMIRGQVQADLNNTEKATADLLKSYKLSPFSEAAMTLAEIAEKRKAVDEAIDYYAQAFALSLDEKDGAERGEIRRRLGKLYAAKHGSEAGLGDLMLRAYDAQARAKEERLAKIEPPNINEGVTDPFQFRLTRLDGSTVRLGDYKGKVIVLNFWATWCGPCRIEMPLLEKTMAKYSADKEVVFLTLNTDEDRELVEPFLKEQKYRLPVVYANYLNNHFGVNSIPTTIIFDRQGNVSFRQAGFAQGEDFVAMLSERIEAARKK